MLGRGLESLIPKKNNHDASGGDDFSDVSDTFVGTDEERGVERQEREGLGILGDLSGQEVVFQRHDPEELEVPREAKIPMVSGPVFQVETHRIVVNPYQPRKEFDPVALDELASSIREFGILQPLVVIKLDQETDTGMQATYQLIAGHRRLLAAQKAGLRSVPVVVKSALKKTEALELAIVENIQREDLNVIETARAYARLSDEFGLTQREIAVRLGKSREAIANALRLLSLPSDIQESLSRGEIQESHARILMQMSDMQKQKDLHKKILVENLSVRDVKRVVRTDRERRQELPEVGRDKDALLKQVEKNLSEFLGAPVRVEVSQNGGKIIIHFYSTEEAFGIAQKIHPEEL